MTTPPDIEIPDWHTRRRRRAMNQEEWKKVESDIFWAGVENVLLLITSAVTILALIALIVLAVMP